MKGMFTKLCVVVSLVSAVSGINAMQTTGSTVGNKIRNVKAYVCDHKYIFGALAVDAASRGKNSIVGSLATNVYNSGLAQAKDAVKGAAYTYAQYLFVDGIYPRSLASALTLAAVYSAYKVAPKLSGCWSWVSQTAKRVSDAFKTPTSEAGTDTTRV